MATAKQWAEMTAEERTAFKKASQAEALKRVESGDFPTGIPASVVGKLLDLAGKKGIARATGATASGGVTYSIPQGLEVIAGGKRFRFNRGLSISILGTKASGSVAELPEGMEEDLLEL